MRVVSGNTTTYIYFVAVDATDFTTRETGLSSFTVYRSRNGGAAAAMTTPTINETDATNMPGVYELLLDEDMTIDSGDDSQEMAFHITHAGMAPVTRTIEIYRPKITAGVTAAVDGNGRVDVGKWLGNTVAWNSGAPDVDVRYLFSSATAAAALKNGALGVINGTVVTGTLSTTQCTTGLSGYADDELIGRTLVFTSGTAAGQVGVVTDYANTGGLLTFERLHDGAALATAPANNDGFVLV